MKEDIRKLAEVYHAEFKRDGLHCLVIFHGRTTGGRNAKFKLNLPWYFWPYMVRDFRKAWTEERNSRTSEIHDIDSAIPPVKS